MRPPRVAPISQIILPPSAPAPNGRVTPTRAHSDAQIEGLVETLVDVWKTLGLAFEARVIPLVRANASDPAHCVYPEMKRAAE